MVKRMNMVSLLKRKGMLLVAIGLSVSLSACGSSGDVAGDDWRTSSAIVGHGTITHEGEGSVAVAVTVDEKSAAFYRDKSEKVLFDSVSFPITIHDAKQAFNDISFADVNGDGESDVTVSFVHGPGESTRMVWVWDGDARYVFRNDLSVVTVGYDSTINDYVGLWKYGDENLWIRIYDDESWELVNVRDEVIEYGTVWVDETGITLYVAGSGDSLKLDRTVRGDLIDRKHDVMLFWVEAL